MADKLSPTQIKDLAKKGYVPGMTLQHCINEENGGNPWILGPSSEWTIFLDGSIADMSKGSPDRAWIYNKNGKQHWADIHQTEKTVSKGYVVQELKKRGIDPGMLVRHPNQEVNQGKPWILADTDHWQPKHGEERISDRWWDDTANAKGAKNHYYLYFEGIWCELAQTITMEKKPLLNKEMFKRYTIDDLKEIDLLAKKLGIRVWDDLTTYRPEDSLFIGWNEGNMKITGWVHLPDDNKLLTKEQFIRRMYEHVGRQPMDDVIHVGDTVQRMQDSHKGMHVGDTDEVSSVDPDGYHIELKHYGVGHSKRYLKKINQIDQEFHPGDMVEILVSNSQESCFLKGDIRQVSSINSSGSVYLYITDEDHERNSDLEIGCCEHVSPECILKVNSMEDTTIRIGDRVRRVKGGRNCGLNVGDEGVVRKIRCDGEAIGLDRDNLDKDTPHLICNFIRIPHIMNDMIKVGDTVRCIRGDHYGKVTTGDEREVTAVNNEGDFKIFGGAAMHYYDKKDFRKVSDGRRSPVTTKTNQQDGSVRTTSQEERPGTRGRTIQGPDGGRSCSTGSRYQGNVARCEIEETSCRRGAVSYSVQCSERDHR